ncbi:MAG: hypothetical protein O7D33_04605 [Chloroflexi bacterium]|nr:hypothetical protein [Chloroflexota bacterium]
MSNERVAYFCEAPILGGRIVGMWLLKDLLLVVGLLVMAVAFIVGVIGYAFDLREIRDEAVVWGLTRNDLLFIILALAFWVVVIRLLYRLHKAESGGSLPVRITNLEALVANIVSQPGVPELLAPASPEELPGLLISRAHIGADGNFIGQSENVTSVTDGGAAGQRDILWNKAYANTDYHLSITPTEGLFEVEGKTVDGISIQTFDRKGQLKDIELDVLAIGDA